MWRAHQALCVDLPVGELGRISSLGMTCGVSAAMRLRAAGDGGGADASSGDRARSWALYNHVFSVVAQQPRVHRRPLFRRLFSEWLSTRWRIVALHKKSKGTPHGVIFRQCAVHDVGWVGCAFKPRFCRCSCTLWGGFLEEPSEGVGSCFAPQIMARKATSQVANSPAGRACTRPSPASRPCCCRATGNISFHHHQPPVGGTGDTNKMPQQASISLSRWRMGKPNTHFDAGLFCLAWLAAAAAAAAADDDAGNIFFVASHSHQTLTCREKPQGKTTMKQEGHLSNFLVLQDRQRRAMQCGEASMQCRDD